MGDRVVLRALYVSRESTDSTGFTCRFMSAVARNLTQRRVDQPLTSRPL
jgi:hypothetical protein